MNPICIVGSSLPSVRIRALAYGWLMEGVLIKVSIKMRWVYCPKKLQKYETFAAWLNVILSSPS